MDQQPGWRVVWPTGTEGRRWTVDYRDRTAGGWMEAAATTWSTNTSTMFQRWDVYLGFGHFATDSSSRFHLWYLVLNVIYNLNTGRRLHGDLRDNWPKASRSEGDEEQEREHGRARDPNQLCQVLPDVGLKVWKRSSWLMSFVNDNHLNISTNIYKCIIFVFSARKERTRQSPRRPVGKNGDIGASQAPKVFIFSCSQF